MSPDTSQVMFRREYEVELESWLRRRFVYLCAAYAALIAGWTALVVLSRGFGDGWLGPGALWTARGVLALAVVGFFFMARGRHQHRDDLLRSASQMILLLGAISIGSRLVGWAGDTLAPTAGSVLWSLFFWHVTACLFLPWSARDSLRPIVPLLAIWAVYTLVIGGGEAPLGARILAVAFAPGILVPGLLICGFRLRQHRQQFRSVMLGRHVSTIRDEMSRARTIHEAMFPAEYDDGAVRVEYAYRPMRELGGDFIHVIAGPGGLVHMTLLDVTGHGLAAALTVNRLYGELERIRAESPEASPGEVLALLNRYVALTLSRHNVFATAISMTIDAVRGELRWSSAGHPPAYLRGANRAVRDLDSTGLLLGALAGDGEPFEERLVELSPGDVIVAYTDGTYEARDRAGRSLGLPRLRGLLEAAAPAEGWPCAICNAVDRHRTGRAEDDVLVTAVTYSGGRRPAATVRPLAAVGT